MPEIKVMEDAKDVGLAMMLADLVRQNLEQKPDKVRHFNGISANVLIEARDIDIIVGLKFERGKLTVSGKKNGNPDLHIITDSGSILDLSLVRIKFGLPYFFDENGIKVLKKMLKRELVIKGLFLNFLTLVRLTNVVSVT